MNSFCLQRRVYALVVSVSVIAICVGAPYKVTANRVTLQSDDVSLPDKKGAWLVSVEHGGGMVYRWDGAAINSDGEIVVKIGRRPRGSGTRINCSCSGKLSGVDLDKLDRAISSGKPAKWLDRYEKGRVFDAPSSNINLSLRGDGSTEQSYHSSWVTAGGAAELRPVDLKQLNDLVWQMREKMKAQCQFQAD